MMSDSRHSKQKASLTKADKDKRLILGRPLRFLKPEEIDLIDDMVAGVEGDGEVHLVVQRGRLRFMSRTTEQKFLNVDKGGHQREPTADG
jgi:hypothetical protein